MGLRVIPIRDLLAAARNLVDCYRAQRSQRSQQMQKRGNKGCSCATSPANYDFLTGFEPDPGGC